MNNDDDPDVIPKCTQKITKKIIEAPALVGDVEARFMKELWLAIAVDLCFHPKLISTAMELAIDEAHALGILVRMWLMAFKYAKDGDLWRGEEESSLRFVTIVTGYKGEAKKLVEVLRKDRWVDGWLIHDWLDYVGPFLVKSYKTSKRPWLVKTWAKYGRKYGVRHEQEGEEQVDVDNPEEGKIPRGTGPPVHDAGVDTTEEAGRNNPGSNQEVVRNQDGSEEEAQDNPIPRSTGIRKIDPRTLSPPAQNKTNEKALNGGLGESSCTGAQAVDGDGAAVVPGRDKGFFIFVKEGGRAEGLNTLDFPLSLVIVEDVYLVYRSLLRFHGVLTARQLREKVAYCRVAPANWMILFQDKVHAVYRVRSGGSLIDAEGADPVAMTIAALRPQKGAPRHITTEASTNLFTEILIDFAQTLCGQNSVWQSRLSGAAISLELERRKGKRGELRKD